MWTPRPCPLNLGGVAPPVCLVVQGGIEVRRVEGPKAAVHSAQSLYSLKVCHAVSDMNIAMASTHARKDVVDA